MPAAETLRTVQETLLGWFEEHARDLPWRRTRDPYRILVSEVMLQQIQVSRAIPFYEAFVARYPSVVALADAPLADVIRTWGDLGRYRRVVNLHRAARRIVDEHGGDIPRDPAILVTLPGVGPYTAGAVACFAFEDDTAFVDTNMKRVLHRLFVGPDVPAPTAGQRDVLALAAAAVPAGRGWTWNQALMEFGALHCTARRPACGRCPVAPACQAGTSLPAALAARPKVSRPSVPAAGGDTPGVGGPADGAHRVYRGKVLAALRELPVDDPVAAVGLDALGRRIRPGYDAGQRPWLVGVVGSLAADGLVAVAEERPAYDADADDGSHTWVSLP